MADEPQTSGASEVAIEVVGITADDEDTAKGVIEETNMGWEGEGPWTYRLLQEPHLSQEFARQTTTAVYPLGAGVQPAYSATIQPCPDPEQSSQDRYTVESWDMPCGTWAFAGVFDGHGGHDTVDFTLAALPSAIRSSLSSVLDRVATPNPEEISALLATCITSFDESLTSALLELFPGGEDAVAAMSDEDIKAIINDRESGGKNAATVARCMRGTTVLVSLVDPKRENLWVASLGDCVAVLGTMNESQSQVNGSVVSATHAGWVGSEVARIRDEHPDEDEAVLRHRVLGAIAVTRAIGDHLFKLPAVYTTRVFSNAAAGFKISTPLSDIIPRIKTPPYVSGTPEVRHVSLKSASNAAEAPTTPLTGLATGNNETLETMAPTEVPAPDTGKQGIQKYLILCSDGLVDLFDGQVDSTRWARVVGKALMTTPDTSSAEVSHDMPLNPASALLRHSFGGDNAVAVSRMLTVEMCERWMDDTTIVVVPL